MLEPCFCNSNKPVAASGRSAAGLVSSWPPCRLLTLSFPLCACPASTYTRLQLQGTLWGPNHDSGEKEGPAETRPMATQFSARVLSSGQATKQEALFAESTRSGTLCLTIHCGAGSSQLSELNRLKHSGLLLKGRVFVEKSILQIILAKTHGRQRKSIPLSHVAIYGKKKKKLFPSGSLATCPLQHFCLMFHFSSSTWTPSIKSTLPTPCL